VRERKRESEVEEMGGKKTGKRKTETVVGEESFFFALCLLLILKF